MSAVRAEAPLAPEFEGEIREFIRRDVAHLRRPQPEGPAADAVNNLNSLLDRVSGSSVTEIDELIRDLRNVRDFLQTEGERVQREITSYAQLSQVAMTSQVWRAPDVPSPWCCFQTSGSAMTLCSTRAPSADHGDAGSGACRSTTRSRAGPVGIRVNFTPAIDARIASVTRKPRISSPASDTAASGRRRQEA